jgi:hypothetical protein
LSESYNGIHALADFIHDVAKYQQSTGSADALNDETSFGQPISCV